VKLAVSTLALPAEGRSFWLPRLAALGFAGVEIAPFRTFGGAEADGFRRAAERAGLSVVGLHGLLREQPDLGLFRGGEARCRAEDRVVLLSQVCRDLGGRTLVLGGERRRGDLDERAAWEELLRFLDAVLRRIEAHGTVLCVDPLGPAEADFCRRAADCRMLVNYVDHPALGLQLSSAAIVENGDRGHAPFAAVRGRLDLFHADEPGLAALGTSGRIDHADFRRHLAAISYRDWVCLHQRAAADPAGELERSARALRAHYLREDNLSLERLRVG
jgi:sugar phosphate isomerase/epimerase